MNAAHDDATLLAALAARFAPGGTAMRLAADASTRFFARIRAADGATSVAVIDKTGGAAARRRMRSASLRLLEAGVPVARILDEDDSIGALLMEDLGDRLLADALPTMNAGDKARCYREAGRIAARIAARATGVLGPGDALFLPRLDRERLRTELALFVTQDIAGRRGHFDNGFIAEIGAAMDWIADEAARETPELAHRDFHARNLLVQPDGSLGAVDFQDALLAPPLYDLASLVRDPYVVPDATLERAAIEGWREERGADALVVPERLAWVALQRDLKAIGTYAFQARIAGRMHFVAWIAPAEALALRAAAELPAGARQEIEEILLRIGFKSASRRDP